MATKNLADFLPEILPFVDGCPDLVARNAVRNAAIDLCDRGRIWRYELDPISIAPKVAEYDIPYPANTYVAHVLRVVLDGAKLEGKTKEDLDVEAPGWQGDGLVPETGDALGYLVSADKRKLRIVRCPDEIIQNGLLIEVALKPSRAVTTLEEFIFQDYLETVALGAKWKLFSMKGMPWANATAAEACESEFNEKCGAASVDSAKSHTRGPLRTKAVYSL